MTATGTADNEELFNALIARVKYAWPTLLLFVTIVAVFTVNTLFAVSSFADISKMHLLLAVMINAICCYASYTVLHESAHGLVFKRNDLNIWIGRLSMLFLSITPFFYLYRYIHLEHHRHANRDRTDPDMFCARGNRLLLPVRWALMDVAYITEFFKRDYFNTKPMYVRREFLLAVVFGLAVLGLVTYSGKWIEFIALYLVPARIGLLALAYCFDYIPHYPHDIDVGENRYQATNNRVGWEWLLTPLLLGQNYHLAHHIYPTARFYRYRRIWQSRQSFHDSHQPRYVNAFELTPYTLETASTDQQ